MTCRWQDEACSRGMCTADNCDGTRMPTWKCQNCPSDRSAHLQPGLLCPAPGGSKTTRFKPDHDWNMVHDIRYDSADRRCCPPNCPALTGDDYPAKGAYDDAFPRPPSFATGGVIKQPVFDASTIPDIFQSGASNIVTRPPLSGERIYISGPMRGHDDLNHPSFDAVEEMLKEYGAQRVMSPAAKDRDEGWGHGTPYSTAIRADIQFLMDATAICLLPGWRESEGARFEAEIARSLDLGFYEAMDSGAEWTYRLVSPPEVGVEGIDQEARRLVYGERAATYGHPRGDFDTIGKIWSGILGVDVTAEQVALCMAGLKLARLASSPKHHDSQVDTIGYMLCLARLQEDPAEIAAWDERAAQYRKDNDLE